MNTLSTWSLFLRSPHEYPVAASDILSETAAALVVVLFYCLQISFSCWFLEYFLFCLFICIFHICRKRYAQCWSVCDRFIAVRLCYLFTYFTVLHYYAALLLKVCVTEWLRPSVRPSVRPVYVHNSRTASSYKFQSWWTYSAVHCIGESIDPSSNTVGRWVMCLIKLA